MGKEQIKELVTKAFRTFVQGEDNSWKSDHNLKVLLQSIEDIIWLDKNCEICGGDGWIWKTEDEKEDCICQKKVIDPNDQYDQEKERE